MAALHQPGSPLLPSTSTATAAAPHFNAVPLMPTTLVWLSLVYAKQLAWLQGKASASSLSPPTRVIRSHRSRLLVWSAQPDGCQDMAALQALPVAPEVNTHSYSAAEALHMRRVSLLAASPASTLASLPVS